MPLNSATTNPKTIKAMKKRYNVVLAGCQAHIKDRKYEDVSLEDVLYIIEHNTNRQYLLANGMEQPSIERLSEYQDMSSEYSVLIEEYKPSVTCDFYSVDYPDYFTGFGYMREGFAVPLFQTRYTGTQLAALIRDEIDFIDYGFSAEQISAINDMCEKFNELSDGSVIVLEGENIMDEFGPNVYFVFND